MALGLKHFWFYIYLIFHRVQVLLRTRHFNMLVIPQIFIMCWKRFRDVSSSQEVYLKYRVNRKTNRKYIETKLCLQSSLNKCCSGDQFPGKKHHESLLSCHHTSPLTISTSWVLHALDTPTLPISLLPLQQLQILTPSKTLFHILGWHYLWK